MVCRPKKMARDGFTLLEVILALALTTVVLLIVTTGVAVQLRAFNIGRAQVERAQLARVLLHRMGDDLRSVLPPSKGPSDVPDISSSKTADDNASNNDSESKDGDSSSNSNEEKEESASTDTESGSSDSTESMLSDLTEVDESGDEDEEESSALLTEPPLVGICGETDWLRIDVVRAVRQDLGGLGTTASVDMIPPAMRQIETIVYYAIPPNDLSASETEVDDLGRPKSGLVRRELVRPMAVWAAQRGALEYEDVSVIPLNGEVRAVAFRYHDGEEWVDKWDTSEKGTLPAAVEIRLYFAPLTSEMVNTLGTSQKGAKEAAVDVEYRLVVAFPIRGEGEPTVVSNESPFDETGEETEPTNESESESEEESSSSGGPGS